MKFDIINDGVWNTFCEYVEKHHSLYRKNHITSTLFEELMVRSLEMNGNHVEWRYGSHKKGTDVTIYPNEKKL